MAARINPSKGGKPDKLARDALIIALKREAVDADGKPTQKLAVIAQKLVEEAATGNVQAAKEIFDRIDGKPAQAIIGGDEDDPALRLAHVIEMRIVDPKN